jgi:hypothetical protein
MDGSVMHAVGLRGIFGAGHVSLQLTLFALASCSGRGTPPDWKDPNALPLYGDNVTLYYDPGEMPCAGTLHYLDASAAAIAKYLDLPLGAPIPYYYTQNLLPCEGKNIQGCTWGPPTYSVSCWGKRPDMVHELVHAIQWRARGWSNSFIEEGLAVSLGELDSLGIANSGASDQDLLVPRLLPPEYFGLAGDFVSYLLTQFGPAPFEKLLASVQPDDSVDIVEAAFASVYGQTMADLRAARSQSGLGFYANRIDLPECQALEPDPRIGLGEIVSESIDCATNAVGAAAGPMKRYVPFDISADGLYALRFETDSAVTIGGLYTCGGGAALTGTVFQPGRKPLVIGYLHAGRYFFTLTAPSAGPQTISFSVVSLLRAPWPSCVDIVPIEVPSATDWIYLFSMDDGTLEVPFVLQAPAVMVSMYSVANPTLNHSQICTEGCGTGCTNAEGLINVPELAAGATFSLRGTFAGQPKLVGENLQAP